jgi:hypothetical protein
MFKSDAVPNSHHGEYMRRRPKQKLTIKSCFPCSLWDTAAPARNVVGLRCRSYPTGRRGSMKDIDSFVKSASMHLAFRILKEVPDSLRRDKRYVFVPRNDARSLQTGVPWFQWGGPEGTGRIRLMKIRYLNEVSI